MFNINDPVIYAGQLMLVRAIDAVSERYLLSCLDGCYSVPFDEVSAVATVDSQPAAA